MNDIPITITGVAVTDAREIPTKTGAIGASFRLASNSRRFNKATNTWVDGDTSYVNINCWRTLASNVLECVHRGDPVVVTGRMRVREWSTGEKSGTSVEVDATSVGHDLARGVTTFAKLNREQSGESVRDAWAVSSSDELVELAHQANIPVEFMDPEVVAADVTAASRARKSA
jgi:single-strand DNA-binding protein